MRLLHTAILVVHRRIALAQRAIRKLSTGGWMITRKSQPYCPYSEEDEQNADYRRSHGHELANYIHRFGPRFPGMAVDTGFHVRD
jgi:hypothetical protein